MNRILFVLVGVLLSSPLFSQDFRPRETWPFLYEEFQSGAARTLDGSLNTEARYNVSVLDGTLLFVDANETIMRADMSRVYTTRIGEDVYVNIMGRMYKVLSELDCGVVVLDTTVDTAQLERVNIGYGKSAVASTQNVSLLSMFESSASSGLQLKGAASGKYDGKELPVKQMYYLRVGMQLIPATRSDVINVPGVDKKAANAFFKQEKIKWKDVASLEKVLVFLNEQINK